MKKHFFYSFILVAALFIACKENEPIPAQVVSSTLAGDGNILFATTILSGAN
jgi:hypothetical protein